jgi:hypothetical protein
MFFSAMLKKPREGKGVQAFLRKKLTPLTGGGGGSASHAKRARTSGHQAESGSGLFCLLFSSPYMKKVGTCVLIARWLFA